MQIRRSAGGGRENVEITQLFRQAHLSWSSNSVIEEQWVKQAFPFLSTSTELTDHFVQYNLFACTAQVSRSFCEVDEACDENNLLSFESLKEISEIDDMLSAEDRRAATIFGLCSREVSTFVLVGLGRRRAPGHLG